VAFSFGAGWLEIYQAMETMLIEAARTSGRGIEFQFWYANDNAEKEESNIRRAISAAPDVLVLMPKNAQHILPMIEAAHLKGIPVIVYNRQQEKHETIKPEAFIGLDTYNQGYTTAVGLFKLMAQDRVYPRPIILLGDLSDRNAINRQRGFRKAAEEFGVLIIAEVETFWDPKRAGENLAAALDARPEANAILLSSDFMIGEVGKALAARNRWSPYGDRNHFYIGSQDAFSEAVPLIKQGYIDVDTAFDIWPMSTTLVQVIWTLHNGGKPALETMLIPGRVLTKDNLDSTDDLWSIKTK
jgi:ABC-type sugar transport system substrate-binding protein